MARAPNLTPEALIDLRRELKRSRDEFGAERTLKLQGKLLERFRQIEAGVAVGHRHQFALGATDRILCLTVRPLLILYDRETRDVLRIVDGRRAPHTLLSENE